MKQELEKCPFCGCDFPQVCSEYIWMDKKRYIVRCPSCGCRTGYGNTAKEAIEFWNRRDKE